MRGLFGGIAAAVAALLSGCDNPTKITQVDRLPAFGRSWIVAVGGGGVPTVVHGTPFESWSAEDVAARLRFTHTLSGVRFRAVAPEDASGNRLLLLFNPERFPAYAKACRGALPRMGPPRDRGFEVQAVFCAGDRWIATGYLEAYDVTAEAPDKFAQAMSQLFARIAPADLR